MTWKFAVLTCAVGFLAWEAVFIYVWLRCDGEPSEKASVAAVVWVNVLAIIVWIGNMELSFWTEVLGRRIFLHREEPTVV